MTNPGFGESPRLKLELMLEGLRYSDSLGMAAATSSPNRYPYRFAEGEPNPTSLSMVPIPDLLTLADGTLVPVKGNAASPWEVQGDRDGGYTLGTDQDTSVAIPIQFEPLPGWRGGEHQ